MKLPYLQPVGTSRVVTDTFLGYRHRAKIADGEFFDTENLTSEEYPLLATRKRRGAKKNGSAALTLTKPGGLIEKDALCWVDNGTLYVNGLATAVTNLSTTSGTEGKQLVGMGAYIVIFPDKVYYNTKDPSDCGSLEASWPPLPSVTSNVEFKACDVDGNVYTLIKGTSAPENPTNGTMWLDTANNVLQQFSSALGTWTALESVYTRVTFTNQAGELPSLFAAGDGVTISGLPYDDLNGEKYIYAIGGSAAGPNEEPAVNDYIVLVGLYDGPTYEGLSVTISRTVPTMDYVCECQNRLWGCYYGPSDAGTLNEIYCCALGDFKNWRQYQGLSTDSWTASVGSDGQWTGAVNYLGHPVFFKENRIHTVTVSSAGAHRIDETVCRGVQKGSYKSLCVVGETLYYKSRGDVCAWQGGFPSSVSDALGDVLYGNAVGGAFDERYYLSMKDAANHWHLFCYDTAKNIWYREDDLHALCFARVDDELWCIAPKGTNTWQILGLNGTEGIPEAELPWSFETGLLYYEYPDRKYLSRYDIRLSMEQGGCARIYMEYDSSGSWIDCGTVRLYGTGSVTIPIRPRRCDHLRMKMVGDGAVKLYSVARVLEVGSDV